jgi:ferrous iron transport protein A
MPVRIREGPVVKSLIDLNPNERGTVLGVQGGRGLVNRLGALGIIPGAKITKISSMSTRGPTTVLVNRTQVALGFGMASKIIVNVERT